MAVMSKSSMLGNSFIGIFSKTNDNLTFVGKNVSDKFIKNLDVLKTEIVKLTVFNSDLIGIYSVANNKGLLVSQATTSNELELMKKTKDLNIEILKTNFNALGNNIVANDFGAIVNPDMEERLVTKINDVLDVEIIRTTIAGHKTVGSAVTATNSGFIAHPKSTTEEIEMMASLFHVGGGIGTANMGIPYPGISIIANKNGFVAGELTTGHELGRINDCLGFVD